LKEDGSFCYICYYSEKMIAATPAPPYYAVIFTSERTEATEGYDDTARRMLELAKDQEGFLGLESARTELGITVSYWKDLESIRKWKMNAEHRIAQQKGQSEWYSNYKTRICLVERDYGMTKTR
jgi:heme-degrading monooxygenase HmoA